VKNSLGALPCFTQIENITIITSGLSQRCFKISADNKVYFAKTITDDTEVKITASAARDKLSPEVFYSDQHWLITTFINANNLTLTTLNTDQKIYHAINLMVRCHKIKAKPTKLDPENIINELINKTHYSKAQKADLLQLTDLILPLLSTTKNSVCCHGDLNFSNVLVNALINEKAKHKVNEKVNQKQIDWLVDYECACTAPAEFDLAMFIAVNNLAHYKIDAIIALYQQHSFISIDRQLLNFYLSFCYFINGLWYYNAIQNTHVHQKHHTNNQIKLCVLAKQQWQALEEMNTKLKILTLPKLSISLSGYKTH